MKNTIVTAEVKDLVRGRIKKRNDQEMKNGQIPKVELKSRNKENILFDVVWNSITAVPHVVSAVDSTPDKIFHCCRHNSIFHGIGAGSCFPIVPCTSK